MVTKIRRPSLALVWAILATITGASSTMVYLVVARKQPWASEFIQLYSTLGMVSGWLNALIYFLAPRSIFLQTRKAGLFFFLAALLSIWLIFHFVFHHPLTWIHSLFLASSLIPVLYANAFGLEFHEGNYPWVYKRVVSFNLVLFLGGLAALGLGRSEAGLYGWALLAGIPFGLLWCLDRWNRIDVPEQRSGMLKPLLNPSLPILERTLWDQWVLLRLDVAQWSLGIYLLGRIVTFTGNVVYSYLLGTNSVNRRRRAAHPNLPWIIMAAAAPLAAGAIRYPWCSFFLGQIFAWILTAVLSSEYESRSKIYGKILGIWILDLALRSVGMLVAQDVKEYLPFLVFSSLANLILLALTWRKRLQSMRPEKTSTKFPLEDFPSIR